MIHYCKYPGCLVQTKKNGWCFWHIKNNCQYRNLDPEEKIGTIPWLWIACDLLDGIEKIEAEVVRLRKTLDIT